MILESRHGTIVHKKSRIKDLKRATSLYFEWFDVVYGCLNI